MYFRFPLFVQENSGILPSIRPGFFPSLFFRIHCSPVFIPFETMYSEPLAVSLDKPINKYMKNYDPFTLNRNVSKSNKRK